MALTLLLIVVIVALMIGLNALYVAGEFAAVSARKARIAQAAAQGDSLARSLLPILEDPHRLDNYIAASQVGITLSSIVLGIYGQNEITPRLSAWLGEESRAASVMPLVVLVGLTILQVVLGELVPKSLALQYPEATARATVLPMRWSADILLRPLITLLNGSGALFLRLLGLSHGGGHLHIHSPEEIGLLVEASHEGGLLDAQERELLDNAFQMGERTVAEVLVPRTRLVALPVNWSMAQASRFAVEAGYTRLLVYEESLDHIAGFVHLKDLFRHFEEEQSELRSLLRPVPFIPETMRLAEAWQRLNEAQSYLAVVFDEYGGTVGLLTREDLVEELFGELQDEFDEELPAVRTERGGRIVIRADLPIGRVNRLLGTDFSEEIATTLGGLVLHELGRPPQPGEEIAVGKYILRVESVVARALHELSLLRPTTLPANEEEA